MKLLITTLILLLASQAQIPYVEAGIVSYGVCQTACNGGWVTCYSLFGAIAGTVSSGAGTPAALLACNSSQGTCMSLCIAFLGTPI